MKWRIDFDKGKYYIIEADYTQVDQRNDGGAVIVNFYLRENSNMLNSGAKFVGAYVNPRAYYPLKTKE